jgi:hypothetical protein
MRILVGVLGGVLVAAMLVEIFVAFLLPRRVKRDPKLVRTAFAYGWRPWRRTARALPFQAGDTMLGIYGPLGLVVNLFLWVAMMMLGYACMLWADGSHLGTLAGTRGVVDFGNDLYFAAATMTTNGPAALAAHTTFARAIQVIDAGSGLAVLAYFRSQHVNQNWLSAMCTVLDACVLTVACAPSGTVDSARFTFAIARHAVVDLTYSFHVDPTDPAHDRLPRADLQELLGQLRAAGIEPATVASRD